MRLVRILLVVSMLLLPILAPSQDEAFIDSLENIIQSPASSDSLIAEAYKHIANHLIEETSTDRALVYLRRLERFSNETPYPEGMLKVHFYKAYYHYRRGRHDSVMNYTGQLAEVARHLDKPREEALALNRMALTSSVMGKYEDALGFFKASQKVNEKAIDSTLQLTNFLGLATLERTQGNYDQAIERYLVIDSLYGNRKNRDHYRIGLALHNVGLIYLEFMKDRSKALDYLLRARDEYDQSGLSGPKSSINVELARIYMVQGREDLADSLFAQSLVHFRKVGHTKKIGETSMKYSFLKVKQEKYQEAEDLLEEAAAVFVDLDAPFSLSDIYHELGLLKRKLGKDQEAVKYFKKAIGLDLEPYQKQKSIRALAQVQHQNGDFKTAYESLESYLINQDSINEAQLKEALQEAEVRYESSQKQQEILALQFAQTEQRSKNIRSLFTAGGLLLLSAVVTFVFYYRARQRRKTNAKLRELDDLKSKLFANISHEFRTPISLIKGPVDLILREEGLAQHVRNNLQVIRRNSVRLTHLIDSVSELTQLDAGKINLKVHIAKLSDHLKVIAASFESLAQSKGCTFRIIIPEDQSDSHYDPQIVETIIYNLLSNAFKYAAEGEVEMNYDRDVDRASISVKDHGPGLSTEDQKRVFDRYFRLENREQYSEGIGIGLALSHELAKLHHGHLSLVSELDTGSTFTFIFPIGKEFFTAEEISSVSPIGSGGQQPVVETLSEGAIKMPPMHEDELVILLVEDNPDMRAHMNQLFSDDYRILLAADGIQGMEMAARFVPDLVISDLMMPNMDGREFLLRLRGDPKTSHIPFIMLTANQLEQEKLRSFQAGVDDFMTKPFSIDEIRVKVENLIRLRQQLREKYAESSVVDAEKIAANDIEQQFWSQVKEVINENLDNVDFSMEDFARAMLMSRMQLHRKLKALTGTSAAVFLRTQRIKAAAQMLRQNNSSVTDVAFDVGFSSPFYFSKCFKEEFGMAPREYAKSGIRT